MSFPIPQKSTFECKVIHLDDYSVSVTGELAEQCLAFCRDKQIPCQENGTVRLSVALEDTRFMTYIEESRRITDEKYTLSVQPQGTFVEVAIRCAGTRALHYALCDLHSRITENRLYAGTCESYPLFSMRGYIEGFYGRPWTRDQRIEMLRKMSAHGMNTYFYAPKDDPYQRAKWRTLYPAQELSALKALADAAKKNHVDFWFCISPGLDIQYSSALQFEALVQKYLQLYGIGIRAFGLLLDDIPDALRYEADRARYPDVVHAHADLANRLSDALRAHDTQIRLALCPMQYHGKGNEYYISKLGRMIDPDILLFWTGRNICSQELSVPEAILFSEHTRHKPLYWDNYPVNDAEMSHQMHLGPVIGRDPELFRCSAGLIANCMPQFHCSKIPLMTIAEYLWNPLQYDPDEAWMRALQEEIGSDADSFVYFAEHLRVSCLQDSVSDRMVKAFTESGFPNCADKSQHLTFEKYVYAIHTCKTKLLSRKGTELYIELLPWIGKFCLFADTLMLCLAYLKAPDENLRSEIQEKLDTFENSAAIMTDFAFRAAVESLTEKKTEV